MTRNHSETPADKGSARRTAQASRARGGHPVLALQRKAGNRAVSSRFASAQGSIPIQRDLYGTLKDRAKVQSSEEDVAIGLAMTAAESGANNPFVNEVRTKFGGNKADNGPKSTTTDTNTSNSKSEDNDKKKPGAGTPAKSSNFAVLTDAELKQKITDLQTEGAFSTRLTERQKQEAKLKSLEDRRDLATKIAAIRNPEDNPSIARRLDRELKGLSNKQLEEKLADIQGKETKATKKADLVKKLSELETEEKSGFATSEEDDLQEKINDIEAKKKLATKLAQLKKEQKSGFALSENEKLDQEIKDMEEKKKNARYDNQVNEAATSLMGDPKQKAALMAKFQKAGGAFPAKYAAAFEKAAEDTANKKKKLLSN